MTNDLWRPGGEAPMTAPHELLSGDLRLDIAALQLHHRNGRVMPLSPAEMRLVACLMHHVGRRTTDEELARAGDLADLGAVAAAINPVRRKLHRLRVDHLLVQVDGGYRLASGAAGFRRVAGLELDLHARAVRMHGRPVEMPRPWFALLDRLSIAPGTLVSHHDLLAYAWGAKASVKGLELTIRELHRALGQPGALLIVAADDGYRLDVERHELLAGGPLLLDSAAGCLRRDDREAQLTAMEWAALMLLWRSAGAPVTRERLIAELGLQPERDRLRCIDSLRAKLRRLAPSSTAPELIPSGWPDGYRLALEHLDPDLIEWPLGFAGLLLDPAGRVLRWGRKTSSIAPFSTVMLEHLINGEGVADYDTVVGAIWPDTPAPTAIANCQVMLQRALDEVGAAFAVQRSRAEGVFRLVAADDRPADVQGRTTNMNDNDLPRLGGETR